MRNLTTGKHFTVLHAESWSNTPNNVKLVLRSGENVKIGDVLLHAGRHHYYRVVDSTDPRIPAYYYVFAAGIEDNLALLQVLEDLKNTSK